MKIQKEIETVNKQQTFVNNIRNNKYQYLFENNNDAKEEEKNCISRDRNI